MHDTDDVELLRQYAEEQSDAAFETLVKRHINLVYSAALRHADNPHHAEEITQAVFIILARKARGLRRGIILSGWLYQTARLTAANFRRTEIRRLHREKEAHMQSVLNDDESHAWLQIAPLLEQAVGGLNEKERNAIVLRFFEKKSLSEVGHAFGTSEDAAKMRVSRALEKLRKFFIKRGITLSTTVLAGAVSAHSVQAAPVELASAVATAAKASAVAVSTLTLVKGTLKLMAWAKAKMAIAVGVSILIGGSTSTTAFMKWEAYKVHRDSWRAPGLKSEQVAAAVPQVRILPTKFSPPPGNLAATVTNDKWGGIGVGVPEMIFAAYNWRPARIVFPDGEPQEKYDFMANLPRGSVEALQRELKKELGLVARRETQEVDVLLLKVQRPDAAGLMPPIIGGGGDWNGLGRYYCDDRALSNPDPPHNGLTRFLEMRFKMPVIDQTGLTQRFHIDLRWNPRNAKSTEAIKQAVLNQLGLELVSSREPVDMLVVEKVN